MKGTNQKINEFEDYRKELNTLGRVQFGYHKFSEADEVYYEKLRNKIAGIVKGWNVCA
jgi:hypothetical protein